jgi:uncharacterized protein
MVITPQHLVDEALELDESIPEGVIEYAPDIRQIGPLSVKGQACAGCLDPVEQPLKATFDLIFRPGSADAEPGERAITEDETEIGYYEESGLSLEDAVREQVLLTLPGRSLCQPDCKGLCPHCGSNRNVNPCDCVEKPVDPRLAVLAGITVGKKA